jgi:phosphoserine phosphatase
VKRLFCFDLDGTITKQELLPLIALEVDLFDEIQALTDATIRGVIPFEKSFLLRCRLLAAIPLETVQSIMSGVKLNQEIVNFIKAHPGECCVITGNLYEWIKPIIDLLGCRFFCSQAEFQNSKLKGVTHVINKGDVVKSQRKVYEKIIAVGDGMGDVPMFDFANVSIAFGGVHQPVGSLLKCADYVVYHEKALCQLLNEL